MRCIEIEKRDRKKGCCLGYLQAWVCDSSPELLSYAVFFGGYKIPPHCSHTQKCSGIIHGELKEPYRILEIKFNSDVCKASTLTSVLSLPCSLLSGYVSNTASQLHRCCTKALHCQSSLLYLCGHKRPKLLELSVSSIRKGRKASLIWFLSESHILCKGHIANCM